jgi:hypothetical protein
MPAFPSFDAERLVQDLPEKYFGTRPPPGPTGSDPARQRIRHASDHLGQNGRTYRRQSGMARVASAKVSVAALLPKPMPKSTKRGKAGRDKSAESFEFEYYKTKLSKPKHLVGGSQNILSEVIVRHEIRVLTEVKRSIPTKEWVLQSERVKTLQSFFAKYEPAANGRSKHGSSAVRRMMRGQPDFDALCAQLKFTHGESPINFSSSELNAESRAAAHHDRVEVERALATLQTEARMRPGAALTHFPSAEHDVPDINPRNPRGIVQQHTDFSFSAAPTKNLQGEVADRINKSMTPSQKSTK